MDTSELGKYLYFLSEEADQLMNQRALDLEQLDQLFVEYDQFLEKVKEADSLDPDLRELALGLRLDVSRTRHSTAGFGQIIRKFIPFGRMLMPIDYRLTRSELEDFKKDASHLAFICQ